MSCQQVTYSGVVKQTVMSIWTKCYSYIVSIMNGWSLVDNPSNKLISCHANDNRFRNSNGRFIFYIRRNLSNKTPLKSIGGGIMSVNTQQITFHTVNQNKVCTVSKEPQELWGGHEMFPFFLPLTMMPYSFCRCSQWFCLLFQWEYLARWRGLVDPDWLWSLDWKRSSQSYS